MFEIEKGIAIPRGGKASARVDALLSMEVGDSFLVQADDIVSMRSTVWRMRNTKGGKGRKFITRKFGNGTMRVWRVE